MGTSRRATDAEVDTWRKEGWVLLEGLVGTDEIDALGDDLGVLFPAADDLHADPEVVTEQWLGRPVKPTEAYVWPDEGPGSVPISNAGLRVFPFPGTGALNRICVHPSIVDFAERALDNRDIRLYQAHASAKYAGVTNYEQPMHIDRNHSWLPPGSESPWWNVEGFLYLTDVTEDDNPTRMVSVGGDGPSGLTVWTCPAGLGSGARTGRASGRGRPGFLSCLPVQLLAPGAPFGSGAGARIVVAIVFKNAGMEWIGYDTQQSRSTGLEWTQFAEGSTPRELELFGWPPPGHPVWTEALLDKTAQRYPNLDLGPWSEATQSIGRMTAWPTR